MKFLSSWIKKEKKKWFDDLTSAYVVLEKKPLQISLKTPLVSYFKWYKKKNSIKFNEFFLVGSEKKIT